MESQNESKVVSDKEENLAVKSGLTVNSVDEEVVRIDGNKSEQKSPIEDANSYRSEKNYNDAEKSETKQG